MNAAASMFKIRMNKLLVQSQRKTSPQVIVSTFQLAPRTRITIHNRRGWSIIRIEA